MNASELKLKIFRQVDSMDENRLREFWGILTNFFSSQKDFDEWDIMDENQKKGIIEAIGEIDAGQGISHDSVITACRTKYSNA